MGRVIKLYLVREVDTTGVHGVLWGKTPADLWDAVDETADPSAFEWAEIRSVSGIWRDGNRDPPVSFATPGEFPDLLEGEIASDQQWERAIDFGLSCFSDNLGRMIGHQEEYV